MIKRREVIAELLNANLLKLDTLVPITRQSKAGHFLHANLPIMDTVLPITIYLRFLFAENALPPILVTPSAIIIRVREGQLGAVPQPPYANARLERE
jgi:hypothetical protein